MSAEVIHIAGYPVKVGPRCRQLCGWCGERLHDFDLRDIAVAPGEDGSPGEGLKPWEIGVLVRVTKMDRCTGYAVVPHTDGDELPAECCVEHSKPRLSVVR